MSRKIKKLLVIGFGYLAVLYPLWLQTRNLDFYFSYNFILNLFPTFGILAFCLLWLHSMSGAFEPWLRKLLDFDKFVRYTSFIIFISIILHPLILLLSINFNIGILIDNYYIKLGIIGWFLLITYDIGKALKKYDFFVKNWTNILTISTTGFILIFFHSLAIGGDLQTGLLRTIWIFYGVTAILATIYTYGIKRLFKLR